jgi:hypothetical protein
MFNIFLLLVVDQVVENLVLLTKFVVVEVVPVVY